MGSKGQYDSSRKKCGQPEKSIHETLLSLSTKFFSSSYAKKQGPEGYPVPVKE
jgi:hypothetical protein